MFILNFFITKDSFYIKTPIFCLSSNLILTGWKKPSYRNPINFLLLQKFVTKITRGTSKVRDNKNKSNTAAKKDKRVATTTNSLKIHFTNENCISSHCLWQSKTVKHSLWGTQNKIAVSHLITTSSPLHETPNSRNPLSVTLLDRPIHLL